VGGIDFMELYLQQTRFYKRCLSLGIGMIAAVLAVNIAYAAPSSKSMIDIGSNGVRIYKNTDPALQSFITSNKTPAAAVQDFVGQQRSNLVKRSLVTESVNPKGLNGQTHLRMSQQTSGLTIYGTYVKSTVRKDGSISSVIENVIDIPNTIQAANVSATQALEATLSRYYPNSQTPVAISGVVGNETSFAQGNVFRNSLTATLVAIPLTDGSLE